MTIVVGVAAPDGIILAADGRTTLYQDQGRHRIISDFAHKVFELYDRFGVATYGSAFVAGKTIAGLMDEFSAQASDSEGLDLEVHELAERLGTFFDGRFRAWFADLGADLPDGWPLGFLVAGYDDEGIGHILEVGVPGREINDRSDTVGLGVLWRGQTDVMRRLIKGVDLDLLERSRARLSQQARGKLPGLEYILLSPTTLQDAVDFASFVIRTTIDMQRFSDGTISFPGEIPGCGGPMQTLAITPAGAGWVMRPWLAGPSRPSWAEGGPDYAD